MFAWFAIIKSLVAPSAVAAISGVIFIGSLWIQTHRVGSLKAALGKAETTQRSTQAELNVALQRIESLLLAIDIHEAAIDLYDMAQKRADAKLKLARKNIEERRVVTIKRYEEIKAVPAPSDPKEACKAAEAMIDQYRSKP